MFFFKFLVIFGLKFLLYEFPRGNQVDGLPRASTYATPGSWVGFGSAGTHKFFNLRGRKLENFSNMKLSRYFFLREHVLKFRFQCLRFPENDGKLFNLSDQSNFGNVKNGVEKVNIFENTFFQNFGFGSRFLNVLHAKICSGLPEWAGFKNMLRTPRVGRQLRPASPTNSKIWPLNSSDLFLLVIFLIKQNSCLRLK